MSEDPLRDMRWARRADRRSDRRTARNAVLLAVALLGAAFLVRWVIRSGVSYAWLTALLAIEARVIPFAVFALIFAGVFWYDSRTSYDLTLHPPSKVRFVFVILAATAIVVTVLTFLFWHFR